jgi:phage-related protein
MITLSPVVKVEKNKLTSDSVFLVMLEITIPGVSDTIRIVNNNEDISWNSFLWQRFPFEIQEVSESSNAETSQFQIKVSNVNNMIGQYIREYDVYLKLNGFAAITVVLYVVNSKDIDNTTAVVTQNLILSTQSINQTEVVFTVSARDLYRARTPLNRMFPNLCRFKFKSTACGYTGAETTCDKTLMRCRELSNSVRFGGFPTIGNKGISV